MNQKDYKEIEKIIKERKIQTNLSNLFSKEEKKVIINQIDGIRNDLADYFEREDEDTTDVQWWEELSDVSRTAIFDKEEYHWEGSTEERHKKLEQFRLKYDADKFNKQQFKEWCGAEK